MLDLLLPSAWCGRFFIQFSWFYLHFRIIIAKLVRGYWITILRVFASLKYSNNKFRLWAILCVRTHERIIRFRAIALTFSIVFDYFSFWTLIQQCYINNWWLQLCQIRRVDRALCWIHLFNNFARAYLFQVGRRRYVSVDNLYLRVIRSYWLKGQVFAYLASFVFVTTAASLWMFDSLSHL